ncbi:adenosylcobinamide amidohydrolase [Mesobacillus selenatarsenatis]|uniref:Vitamin B12 ABC transporter, ATPase component BtuD/adenosylcobinamide amidohydrolase n=1 Tax=Mesobacillus selenatarsenatis (strain DSM 18680 / JCM 14380 / FERM P-15431 / SF-1) TaxID=1321606 RepID=A0A0A8WYX5_MESS1|nr:adenosylcobinamide amidohydrolase [Mesobacillus selenatarsenatis]GAM12199.1 vitamin B12 ABC transporter, ATPase component BtuD/adenosylcobinamide amidohydrolase [Mesobacillus selenatarsenatis SF-1]
MKIGQVLLSISEKFVVLESPIPLKAMSSGVVGSGTGWYNAFVNRHVDKDYDCSDHRQEMIHYLSQHGFDPAKTVGMMTAVMLEDVSFKLYQEEGFSVFIVVTAGVGNAVDVSRSGQNPYEKSQGTINTWVFINGELTEEAFIQSIMTATEAKTKALHDLEVRDRFTGTIATGTSTDSILIAATQQGKKLEYAGSITPLGMVIGNGIHECTVSAIKNSRKRVSK